MSTLDELMDALDARDVDRLGRSLPVDQEAMDRALLAAALRGETGAARILLTSGANPDVTDSRGDPCLICIGTDYPMMRLLLKHGANVNAVSVDGITALHLWIINQYPDAIDHLFEHGAITELPNGICALGLARRYESAEVIAQLERARIHESMREPGQPKTSSTDEGFGL